MQMQQFIDGIEKGEESVEGAKKNISNRVLKIVD